jgi:hypothetical protein
LIIKGDQGGEKMVTLECGITEMVKEFAEYRNMDHMQRELLLLIKLKIIFTILHNNNLGLIVLTIS